MQTSKNKTKNRDKKKSTKKGKTSKKQDEIWKEGEEEHSPKWGTLRWQSIRHKGKEWTKRGVWNLTRTNLRVFTRH